MSDLKINRGPALGDGWIARHRSVRDHWLVGHGMTVKPADPDRPRCHSRGEAWEDLLMECRYADGYVNNGGHKMALRRGELLGAVSWLANRWNWTPKTVRGFLDALDNDGMIALVRPGVEEGKQKGKQANVISVCNYDKYQYIEDAEGQATGQAEGKQRASRGQAEGNNIRKNKGTREQGNTQEGGGPAIIEEAVFEGCDAGPTKAEVTAKDVLAAFQVYAKAAEHFDLAKTTALTDARKKRIEKRLADIGGIEAFTEALRALRFTSDPFVKFIRGQTRARPGELPFRLDIDRVLQTEGNLGDVLARLLDISRTAGDAAGEAGDPWLKWSPEEWERQIDQHANGIWPIAKLGFPPGRKDCACPAHIIERRRLTELYDANGIARRRNH